MPEIRIIQSSGSIPTVTQLPLGDIAINSYDGKAYIKQVSGSIQNIIELGTGTGGSSISASYATTASYAFYAVTSSYALNFNPSATASYAITASHAISALSSSFARTASYVLNAVSASYATNALSSSYAATASYSFNTISASYAGTASYVNPLVQNVNITGNLVVKGTASVDVLITTYESSSIIYSSGSTKFGDSLDDTHQFTGSVYITGSQLTWNNSSVITSAVTSSMTVLSASFASTASYYRTFPYTGSALITGSLGITGSTSITSGSLSVYKSGSTVVDIQGSQGQLFSIIDALSGSLMSVNDISGLPILEVFSDDRVIIGTYGAPGLTVSGSKVAASGSFTGSFTGSFLGTSSWASNAISSSYARTGSYINPLFQPVFISGSTEITGSTTVKGDFTVTSATTIDFNTSVFNVNAPTFQVPSFALPYSPSANVRVVMYDAVSNILFVTASAPASAVITNLIATGSVTASVQIGPAATVPYFFLVQSGSAEMLKINAERVVVFESRTDTPTAVTGGLFYSASGDFFFGM